MGRRRDLGGGRGHDRARRLVRLRGRVIEVQEDRGSHIDIGFWGPAEVRRVALGPPSARVTIVLDASPHREQIAALRPECYLTDEPSTARDAEVQNLREQVTALVNMLAARATQDERFSRIEVDEGPPTVAPAPWPPPKREIAKASMPKLPAPRIDRFADLEVD